MGTIIKLKKNYSISELYNNLGPNWRYETGLYNVPKIFNKKKIKNFYDFDVDTKNNYILLAKLIKSINDDNIDVWAIGSRVDGCWKTEEEAEFQAKKYNKKFIKYSDYDFTTNAKNLPNFKRLEKHFDYCKYAEKNKVLIPRKEYY